MRLIQKARMIPHTAGFSFPMTASAAASTRRAKRALVTGVGPNGIGGETVLGLVRALPTLEEIYLCTRDKSKAEAVGEAAQKTAFPAKLNIHFVPLDLSALSSVRECARTVSDCLGDEMLDVAVLNAGVMACPLNYTMEGLEYQYGVNHMGHALLAMSLRNRIARSVYVSSTAVGIARGRTSAPRVAEKLRSANDDASKYSRWGAYGDSKLAMSMFARGVALDGDFAVSLHPGVVNTELSRHILPKVMFEWGQRKGVVQDILRSFFSVLGFKTPAQGAELSIQLASEDKGIRKGALYFSRNSEASALVAPLLQDDALCREVKEDTLQFLTRFVSENEGVSTLELAPAAKQQLI